MGCSPPEQQENTSGWNQARLAEGKKALYVPPPSLPEPQLGLVPFFPHPSAWKGALCPAELLEKLFFSMQEVMHVMPVGGKAGVGHSLSLIHI